MSWKQVTIGDLVTLQRGHDLTEQERKPGSVPVIGSAGPNGTHSIALQKGPSFTIGRSGGSIGKVTFVPTDYWPHNTCLYAKDLKGNNPRFLAYFLSLQSLAQLNSGAAQPSLNRNFVHSQKVHAPDVTTQTRIASILSAYDDLIENNRRRIAVLEKAARLLYREWFVHLRFPGHETASFVDGLPYGWQLSSIGRLSSFISRGITPTYNDEALGIVINQKCIRENRVSLNAARKQSKRVPNEKLVRKYDILVNSTGAGTLGRVAQNFAEISNMTVDSHITILRPQVDVDPIWFGQAIVFRESLIETLGRGATNQTELGREDLSKVEALLAPPEVQSEFSSIVEPLLSQSMQLGQQNAQLTRARDLLLPRLMDGRIPV